MERLVDKTVLLACAAAAAMALAATPARPTVAALAAVAALSLAAEAVTSLRRSALWQTVLVGALSFAAAVFSEGVWALPLATYDAARAPWRIVVLFPIAAWLRASAAFAMPPATSALIAALMALAALMSLRAARSLEAWARNHAERDALAERSQALEAAHRDLAARRELELRLAVLEERSRIAREIHDNVGHLLTRAVLQTRAYQVVHADDAATSEEFAAVEASVSEALDSVRTSVHDLHRDTLDVGVQVERIAQESTLDVSCEVEAVVAPPEVAACLTAIVREALSNAARHGNATAARIRLSEQPGFWQLVVTDNGATVSGASGDAAASAEKGSFAGRQGGRRRGANADAREGEGVPSGGLGLISMAERVRALNGTFRAGFDDAAGGWRVLASIPKPAGGR